MCVIWCIVIVMSGVEPLTVRSLLTLSLLINLTFVYGEKQSHSGENVFERRENEL